MYDLRSQRILDFSGHPVPDLTVRQLELALTLVIIWHEQRLLPLRVQPGSSCDARHLVIGPHDEYLCIWCPEAVDPDMLRAALEDAGWENALVTHGGSAVTVPL